MLADIYRERINFAGIVKIFEQLIARYIGLATRWLRILALDGIDKSRNHLVAKPILVA